MGRHLVATAPVGDLDLERTKTPSRSGGVHRDVAATDDDDALAGQVGGLPECYLPEEVQAGEYALGLLTRHAQRGRAGGAGRKQYRVIALGLEPLEVLDMC